MELVTFAYRAVSALCRYLPGPVVETAIPRLVAAWSVVPSDRRRQVVRHQLRVEPWLSGEEELSERVREVYRSYGRYYAESFRLPSISVSELDRRMSVEGYEHMEKALGGDVGPIVVLPHLGSWEWCAHWFAQVKGQKVTAVVERLEPPSLFEWFADFRRKIGINVVALDKGAASVVTRALRERHVVALVCDRDIVGNGIPVTFFGETTTMPGGPATLALRTGAPLIPVAVYDRPGGHHQAVGRPPIPVERKGTLRADVARVTQDIADVLEDLIRAAPEQWHLMQPNWPSDRKPLRL